MLTLEERRWVISMLHACPDQRYLTREDWRFELALLIQKHVRYLIAVKTGKLAEDIDDGPLADWIRHIVATCPRYIISGVLDKEIITYALAIIESPLNKGLARPEILNRILGLLDTKSMIALACTHPLLQSSVGYDPFAGRRGKIMLGNLGLSVGVSDLTRALNALAMHAFNVIFDRLPAKKDKARFMDKQLTEWSSKSSFGMSGKSFLATNCVAKSTVSGKFVTTVNFISYGTSEKERLVKELELDASDYVKMPQMHGEMRLAEKQDATGKTAPIFVDKLCCPFCAIQMMALGRMDDTRGATTTTLAWYTFSPIVMYLRRRRVLLWGNEVEWIFNRLQPDTKLLFLELLSKICRTSKYTGLPALGDLKKALMGK